MISTVLDSEKPRESVDPARPDLVDLSSHASAPVLSPPSAVCRVGFIGTGYIADWHARAVRNLKHVHLVAVCDRHEGRRMAFAETCAIPRHYSDWNEMLQAESLDAVHILLPPHLHFAAARDALEAGVDVLVEKPLGIDLSQVEELVGLAETQGRYLAVGHNFAFDLNYERLREDLRRGVLGRVDQVTITWNRELPQILHATPSNWMFERPENLMLEVGPHSVAHMFDLMGGPPCDLHVRAENPRVLSNGRTIYRRWLVDADYGESLVRLVFSFVPGYTEHQVHVRGSLASATADLEGWNYRLQCHSQFQDDFDRYQMARRQGKALLRQARGNLARYVGGKFGLTQRGNQYGYSIQRACEAFYRGMRGARDERVSAGTGLQVIRTCLEIGERAGVKTAPRSGSSRRNQPATSPISTLVLGGTGFIGRELVRQLAEANVGVRVLARDHRRFDGEPQWDRVDIQQGDLSDPSALHKALEGIDTVYHLARAYGNTWEDFARNDLPWTQQIAEACLQRGVKRLIYSGTIDSYYAGGREDVITEKTPLDPKIHLRKPYARAKAEAEALLLAMHREQGLPVVIARPGIVIGRGGSPFHWGVGMFTHQAVAHLWGDGENPLPLVLVQDVAQALLKMGSVEGIDGQSFNLIGDSLLSAREYVAELEHAAGIKLQLRPTPILKYYLADMFKYAVKVLVRHPGRYRPSFRDWQGRTQLARFDCSETKRVLGWRPVADRRTLVEEGIRVPVAEFLL